MKNLGHKLKTLREFHNYKQQFVGNLLGIGQSAYSRMENGNPENISLGHLSKLAELYNMSPEQIFGWDGKIILGSENSLKLNNENTVKFDNVEDRIKYLEEKIDQLMSTISKV